MSHQSFPRAIGSITDGYVLTFSAADGYWKPKPPTGGSGLNAYTKFTNVLDSVAGPVGNWSGTYVSTGGSCLIMASWNAYASTNTAHTFNINVDGSPVSTKSFFFNQANFHSTITTAFYVGTLSAGSHTISISTPTGANINNDDYASLTVIESIGGSGPIVGSSDFSKISTDVSTTSTSYSDLITKSVSINGTEMLINFTANGITQGGADSVYFRILVDGSPIANGGGWETRTSAGSAFSCANVIKLTGLTPGSHTVKLQWRVAVGSGVAINAATAPDTNSANLLITEGKQSYATDAGGDLANTYPNPIVAKIQGRAVSSTAPTDGYALIWNQSDGYWKPTSISSGNSNITGTYTKLLDGTPGPASNWTGSYNSSGGFVFIQASVAAYSSSGNNTITLNLVIDGVTVATSQTQTTSTAQPRTLNPILWGGTLPSGIRTIALTLTGTNAIADSGDNANLYVISVVGSGGSTTVGSGWQPVYEVDLAGLPSQSFSGNGAVTIDGKAWNVENFSAATSFGLVPTEGLKFVCNTSNTDLNNSTRNSLIITVPVSTLYPAFDLDKHEIRVLAQFTHNADQNFENILYGYEYATSPSSQNFMMGRGYNGSGQSFFVKNTLNNSSSNPEDTSNISDDVMILEMNSVNNFVSRTGVYSSGWPTTTNLRKVQLFTTGGDLPFEKASDVRLCFSCITNNTSGTMVGTFKKLRLEVRTKGGGFTIPLSTSAPTNNQMLVYNRPNSTWEPRSVATDSGWTTALDLDLTTQGSQTFSTNGNYTIAGLTFNKTNSANDASAPTLDSTGLTFQPGSTSDYNGSRTMPAMFLKFADVIPNFDLSMDVRVTVYNSALNNTNNYDCSIVAVDTNSTTFGVGIKRGHGTAGVGFQSFYNKGGSNVSGFISSGSAPSSSNNVIVIETPQIGNLTKYKTYDGAYPAAFTSPSVWNPHKGYAVATGTLSNDDVLASALGLTLGAQRAGSGTSLVVKFARIKIEYKNVRMVNGTVDTYSAAVKSSAYTMSNSDKMMFVDLSSSAVTITLPPSPSIGQWHKFKDHNGNASTNNLTISGNGINIERFTGSPGSTLVLNNNYDAVELVYNGTTWSIV